MSLKDIRLSGRLQVFDGDWSVYLQTPFTPAVDGALGTILNATRTVDSGNDSSTDEAMTAVLHALRGSQKGLRCETWCSKSKRVQEAWRLLAKRHIACF